jgi:selenide,water dikinase
VGPGDLRAIMAGLPRPTNPSVVVGTETSDDAGVYRLSEDTAIVCTADFITPVLDDPNLFGQIAAANSLSDVYAMGGEPRAAIALCMFPKELDADAARAILAGGQAKVEEAGGAVIGGHTVRSPELLYGLSVTGVVDPCRVWRNVGARPGDALVITKPLGTGLIINGLRKGAIELERARPILEKLAVLNRAARDALVELGADVHAVTDVTGFGLVGHAQHMTVGSNVGVRFFLDELPLYPHVREMVDKGVTTGSTRPNRAGAAARLRWERPVDKFWDELVHDPQTSGGLLAALTPEAARAVCGKLPQAKVIGEVLPADEPYLTLR